MIYAPARKAALPAVLLTGLFVALLVVMMQSRGPAPVPVGLHVGLGAAYLIVALLVAGADPVHAAGVLLVMLATQAAMALLIALVYVAAEAPGMALSEAWIYSLTSHLPGLLLQAAVVFLMAPVAAAWLGGQQHEESLHLVRKLPAMHDGPSLQKALDMLCERPPVAGVAVCRGRKSLGAGVWSADPKAACQRGRLLVERAGKACSFFPLDQAGLWVDIRSDRDVVIIMDDPTTEHLARAIGARLRAAVAKVMESPK